MNCLGVERETQRQTDTERDKIEEKKELSPNSCFKSNKNQIYNLQDSIMECLISLTL